MSLTASRAIVVGGGSGIGLASAAALADAGAAVTITGRSFERLAAARAANGNRFEIAAFDAADEAASARFFEAEPPFDHLVLCANAGGAIGPFAGLDPVQLREYLDSKLWAYLTTLRHAPRRLRPGGSVTLVNGAASRIAVPGMAALAVVNGGLDALVRPLALELAPTRVNAVAPGFIDTPYWAKLPDAERTRLYAAAARVPANRVGRAEDVARAIVFLAASSFVTGVVLEVDGGRHLTPQGA
jgi:NAD(P)-dependent dehydrogenase (short-subunit alcohol dehydrogenase family)